MKTLRLLLLLSACQLFRLSAFSADYRITATIAITNAPTTNGMTVTIAANGTTVRTWTNSVSIAASQILTNATATGAATNLYNQLVATPPVGVAPILMSSPTNIVLYGQSGINLQVSFSVPAGPGYASVTYSTNPVTPGVNVRVPYSAEALAQQTNISSGLVDWLNLSAPSNQLKQASPAMAQLVGTTNTQTIPGTKTFTGSNYLANARLESPRLNSPTTTNLVNYGNALQSPGSASQSEQFGNGAVATASSATAIGYLASAVNSSASALGDTAAANGAQSTALGAETLATGDQTVALGYGAFAQEFGGIAIGGGSTVATGHTNSVAIGYAATTTKSNQVMLGSSSHVVTIPGSLEHLKTTGTNSFSDIAFRRYANSGLANGNNAAVLVGTNSFMFVSGPSAAFAINGLNGSPNRDGQDVVIVNLTGQNMTIAHDSGVDPTAANRIYCLTGADRATTGNGAAWLRYDSSSSRWILLMLDP